MSAQHDAMNTIVEQSVDSLVDKGKPTLEMKAHPEIPPDNIAANGSTELTMNKVKESKMGKESNSSSKEDPKLGSYAALINRKVYLFDKGQYKQLFLNPVEEEL